MRPALFVLALAAACGSPPKPEAPTLADPALQRVAFMAGAWKSADDTLEVWTPAGDALFGVAFVGTGFEAAILSIDDGAIVYHAMPGGRPAVPFRLAPESGVGDARFANPEHDEPQLIRYARTGDTLRATVSQLDGSKAIALDFAHVDLEPASMLADADRQFAADTAAHGSAGWTPWFAPDGAMLRGTTRTEGHDAIKELMSPLLDDPAKKLLWEPVASGLAPSREIGFTVGEASITDHGKTTWRGAYVTIWQQQPDGTWRVLFDTGDDDTATPP